MKPLSNRMEHFTESVIRHMTRIANACGAINLSQGFPDFDPPKALQDRLAEVAHTGPHQYALTIGAQKRFPKSRNISADSVTTRKPKWSSLAAVPKP